MVIIEDDHSDKESLGVPKIQGTISPIQYSTLDTCVIQQIKNYPKEG